MIVLFSAIKQQRDLLQVLHGLRVSASVHNSNLSRCLSLNLLLLLTSAPVLLLLLLLCQVAGRM
jgi:hypothetical protein